LYPSYRVHVYVYSEVHIHPSFVALVVFAVVDGYDDATKNDSDGYEDSYNDPPDDDDDDDDDRM